MNVNIDNRTYEVVVKRKRVKYTNIKIRQNTLIITSFRYLTETDILMFIEKNKNAIKKLISKTPINPLKEDEFLLFGKIYKLKLSDDLQINENIILSPSTKHVFNYAFNIISILFDNLQREYFKDTPAKLIFKKMRSRWGVCYLKKATIALTVPIIHLPIETIKYVIIHEFCHFKYPNHSKDFYNYVSIYCPDYKMRVKELKSYAYVI